jgi:hypothetical protein
MEPLLSVNDRDGSGRGSRKPFGVLYTHTEREREREREKQMGICFYLLSTWEFPKFFLSPGKWLQMKLQQKKFKHVQGSMNCEV